MATSLPLEVEPSLVAAPRTLSLSSLEVVEPVVAGLAVGEGDAEGVFDGDEAGDSDGEGDGDAESVGVGVGEVSWALAG